MTVKNLAAYFFNNGDPDTVTVHPSKNGVNWNLTCSIASQSNALGQSFQFIGAEPIWHAGHAGPYLPAELTVV